MPKTPTKRTLDLLESQGFVADVVERWIPRARIRKDLFGFADVIAMSAEETVLVQSTSYSNASARIKKSKGCDGLWLWLSCPTRRFYVHGWRKVNGRWVARIVEVTPNDGP